MKKITKKLIVLLLFCFAVWMAGCTSQKKPSGVVVDATAGTTQSAMQETVAAETTSAEEQTTRQKETEEQTATEQTTTEEITTAQEETTTQEETTAKAAIAEDGVYTSKNDVALYLHTYGKLPSNFITKKQAEALGWSGGGLDDYAYGTCIGGDKFGNYEGNLPTASGRQYYECDIDTLHAKKRGAKRIVFSNDGLIYYTEDHYNTFELLYE